jgi:hypothetical protein
MDGLYDEPKPSVPGKITDEQVEAVILRITGWVTNYNTQRPHLAMGYETPAAYAAALNTQRTISQYITEYNYANPGFQSLMDGRRGARRFLQKEPARVSW